MDYSPLADPPSAVVVIAVLLVLDDNPVLIIRCLLPVADLICC